ncbi:MAG: SPFH domain-containing protein [Chloroflexota bacterium]
MKSYRTWLFVTLLSMIILIGSLYTKQLICAAPGLALLVLGLLGLLQPQLYRPPDNTQAVVYRLERFHAIQEPSCWRLLIPMIDEVQRLNRLGSRTREIHLKNIYTRDQVPFDLKAKIFYQVNLQLTAGDFIPQAVHFPDEAWGEIVATNFEKQARNRVFLSRSYRVLNTPQGREAAQAELSRLIAERVEHMGIVVNPHYGVNLMELAPNPALQTACETASAAQSKAQAVIETLKPVQEQLVGPHNLTPTQLLALKAAGGSADLSVLLPADPLQSYPVQMPGERLPYTLAQYQAQKGE